MTPDLPILRYALAEELPAVVDLCMLVEEQHERYWPLRWQRRPNLHTGWLHWLESHLDSPNMLILVAAEEPSGENRRPVVIGALLADIASEMPIYTYSRYAFIHDLAVLPEYRSRGIGHRLLEYAANWARSRGVNQLRLMAAVQNPEAIRVFSHAGFRPTYQEMVLPL